MRNLDLGRHRRGRVWIGEVPDVAFAPANTLTFEIVGGKSSFHETRLAAVEVLVPLGPNFMYGLLGGRWQPEPTDVLRVVVGISDSKERLFRNNLTMGLDEVHVGLLSEYAHSVRTGIDLVTGETHGLAGGKLSMNYCAHGAIGSCEAVFKHLAIILVRLLHMTAAHPSDEELLRLFPASFS
jgi:hypothetical protein